MLYETFISIRELLKAVPELKAVQWYNAQYEGTIYVSPVAFVEFPESIPLDRIVGNTLKADSILRIHVVSAVAAGQDSSIGDTVVQEHEGIAEKAMEILNGKQIKMQQSRTTALMPCGWQHYHKYRGFLITFVDFKMSAILE